MPSVSEIGGSLSDFMASVRSAFEKQFPPTRRGDHIVDRFWVRDIFEDYVVVRDEQANQLYRVTFQNGDNGLRFADRRNWEKVKLTYTKEIVSDQIVTEFKGAIPDVPVRNGVDMDALTQGDSDPFFITMEISSVGKVSGNGLLHDDDLANSLVQQINARGTEGIMGHIKQDERSTAYPVSDIHWLGATRQGTKAWAKGYIPKTAVSQREHYRILKATNGRAATSITGPAVREFVDKQKGIWKAKGFELEQLDLAPFTRAALKPESDFVITREMNYQSNSEDDMTKEELLAELTAKDIPQTVREQIIQDWQRQNNTENRIAELEQQLNDQKTVNETLTNQLAEVHVREFEAAVDGVVAEFVKLEAKDDDGKKRVDALRRMFRSQILSEMGDERDKDKVRTTAQTLWEEEFQVIAETIRDALAGPPAFVPGRERSNGKLDDTPENRANARRKFSF